MSCKPEPQLPAPFSLSSLLSQSQDDRDIHTLFEFTTMERNDKSASLWSLDNFDISKLLTSLDGDCTAHSVNRLQHELCDMDCCRSDRPHHRYSLQSIDTAWPLQADTVSPRSTPLLFPESPKDGVADKTSDRDLLFGSRYGASPMPTARWPNLSPSPS